MPRFTTTFTAAASAALAALAVTVVAPAIGGDATPGATAQKGEAKIEHQEGPTPDELRACLQSNGATDVPGDERDGRALKEWIVAHQGDESSRAALKACDVYFDGGKPGQHGPDGAPVCAAPGDKAKSDDAAGTAKARRVRSLRARATAKG